MPELRWTLLVLGVVFVAALAWRELRRPRHARGDDPERSATPAQPEEAATSGEREVPFTLPEIRAREPVHDLPIVEIDDDSLIGLRLDGERVEETASPEPLTEAILPPPPAFAEAATVGALGTAPPPQDPIVEWPPDGERQIVAVRLVSPSERFAGRAVRQALSAEGFLPGKFSIFHKCGIDARAVVSAANLTNPGTFDPQTMDIQRFAGLNLFIVMPGPLAPRAAFDELISSARNLNSRLQGALQDEQGAPLTPTRIMSMREGLPATLKPPGTISRPSA